MNRRYNLANPRKTLMFYINFGLSQGFWMNTTYPKSKLILDSQVNETSDTQLKGLI